MATGLSPAVETRWFRESGGMPPFTFAPLSDRYLSFAEREKIATPHAQGCGVRAIARRLGRSPSTISRELRRNAATRGGNLEYRATTAQWHADRRAKRPKLGPWTSVRGHCDLNGCARHRRGKLMAEEANRFSVALSIVGGLLGALVVAAFVSNLVSRNSSCSVWSCSTTGGGLATKRHSASSNMSYCQ